MLHCLEGAEIQLFVLGSHAAKTRARNGRYFQFYAHCVQVANNASTQLRTLEEWVSLLALSGPSPGNDSQGRSTLEIHSCAITQQSPSAHGSVDGNGLSTTMKY
eukprot:TRINITY_DN11348_c0_g1_i1.p2 TRINITY_DN11348_c0_g1~~TRINITY_DN11348_c0_g1_i1.p2  ORF type:complete len:104 (+),score=11.22 TRINITY_DN11348_c0_g1_i1:189-500(+)